MDKMKSKIAVSLVIVSITAGMTVGAQAEGLEWFQGEVEEDFEWTEGSSSELNITRNAKTNSIMQAVRKGNEQLQSVQGVGSAIRWW